MCYASPQHPVTAGIHITIHNKHTGCNLITALCVSFTSPGGTLCVCCSVDHDVPCREHRVPLLHFQPGGAVQQVVCEQVLFMQWLCVFSAYILFLFYLIFEF